MILGNNVELKTVNGNGEIKHRLFLTSDENAEAKEVSAGISYWQFVMAAVTVMYKNDHNFDIFYFPRRDLEAPLTCGPHDALEIKILGTDIVYRVSDGWFVLNHQPGKQQLPDGRDIFLGDYYLGTSVMAGNVFGEKLENGCWNISARNEDNDDFETEEYTSFTPASDGDSSAALRSDGRYDVFSGGYRLQTPIDGGYMKMQIKGGSMLFFDDGVAWKLVYQGPDCLPETFEMSGVLVYDEGSDYVGTLIIFDDDQRYEEHGEIVMLDEQMIAVNDKIFCASTEGMIY